jgi:MYXO-CTERM domain-containing protein
MRAKMVGVLLGLCLLIAAAPEARAFCGFYVGGAGAKLFNNATMVVMMREGKRTVLSMQNNYQGPPSDFAMVVPVPVVLQKENVKTLPPQIFSRVDQLAAPRLVEYWEQDPCAPMPRYDRMPRSMSAGSGGMKRQKASKPKGKVTIEAQFVVGEYEIVILSATGATALDDWLRAHKYNIPAGAAPILRPYVQQGMKFFVAKVNSKKVKFKGGQAMLSPLRFHYDSDLFALPVRLGLLNSKGTQDLIVHILSRGQRYELANYDNVTIPTNFDVSPRTAKSFGAFYVALFDEVMKRNPRSVVTEYSWNASSCDPCPTPALTMAEIKALGADVLTGGPPPPATKPTMRPGGPRRRRPRSRWGAGGFVLTRLHTRYSKHVLGEDLVFRQADPIVGGRERTGAGGKLEHSAKPGSVNNFQARYIIRHRWKGAVACKNPRRGIWGGPPGGHAGNTRPKPALNLAFAPRRSSLKTFVSWDVASWTKRSKGKPMGLAQSIGKGAPSQPGPDPTPQPTATASAAPTQVAQNTPAPTAAPTQTAPVPIAPPSQPRDQGCGSCAVGSRGGSWPAGTALFAIAAALWLRRRRLIVVA